MFAGLTGHRSSSISSTSIGSYSALTRQPRLRPATLYVTLALKLHQVCPLLCGLAVGLSAGNAVPRLTHGLGEDHIVTTINQ
jgi:hypothetical protein